MLVENQLVEVKWNNNTKAWYEDKGYKFTHKFDSFYVRPSDLPDRSAKKVHVICDYCGTEYITSFSVYNDGIRKNGKNACSHCAAIKAKSLDIEKRKIYNYERVQEVCKNNGYELLSTIDDCNLVSNQIQYKCPLHGTQTVLLDSLIHGHLCYDCGREATTIAVKKSIAEVVETVESKNNNKLINPSEYKDMCTANLKIECGSCGKVFLQSLSNYKKNLTGKCPDCNENSYGEYLIALCLDKYSIAYNRQFKFSDCKDKRKLPFDFYLPDYNLVVEFDGKYHYEPISGEESFKKMLLHDAMKNWYCKWNNIKLLRIPYWERDNIEQILIDYLHLAQQSNYKLVKTKYIQNRKVLNYNRRCSLNI